MTLKGINQEVTNLTRQRYLYITLATIPTATRPRTSPKRFNFLLSPLCKSKAARNAASGSVTPEAKRMTRSLGAIGVAIDTLLIKKSYNIDVFSITGKLVSCRLAGSIPD
jgi:hypothetical protein